MTSEKQEEPPYAEYRDKIMVAFEEAISSALEECSGCCLDDAEDRRTVIIALAGNLRPFATVIAGIQNTLEILPNDQNLAELIIVDGHSPASRPRPEGW